MKKQLLSVLAASALALTMSSANASENPFGMSDLQKTQQVSMSSMGGKCMGSGDEKSEGKCGDAKKKAGEGKCGDSAKKSGKCSG